MTLLTRDRPIAKTYTWHHTTQTRGQSCPLRHFLFLNYFSCSLFVFFSVLDSLPWLFFAFTVKHTTQTSVPLAGHFFCSLLYSVFHLYLSVSVSNKCTLFITWKYLQSLPTRFGPQGPSSGQIYREHMDTVTYCTYKPRLCWVAVLMLKAKCVCAEVKTLKYQSCPLCVSLMVRG